MQTTVFENIGDHEARLEAFDLSVLTENFILSISDSFPDTGSRHFFSVHPELLEVNKGVFTNPSSTILFPPVAVTYDRAILSLRCSCGASGTKLCTHQAQVLLNILKRADLRIFFDAVIRHQQIVSVAKNYGVELEAGVEDLFEIQWANRSFTVVPRSKHLQLVTTESLTGLADQLFQPKPGNEPPETDGSVLIFSAHKFYGHLQVAAWKAELGSTGKLKKLKTQPDPLPNVWNAQDALLVKFYTALGFFVNNHAKAATAAGLAALQAIVRNPAAMPAFYHDAATSENLVPLSLVPVQLQLFSTGLELQVYLREPYYELSGQLQLGESRFPLNEVHLKYGYFCTRQGCITPACSL